MSFKGIRTVVYRVAELDKAKKWYATAFETEPYFDEPFYVGFNIAGYELGLQPEEEGHKVGNNSITYWGVDNIKEAYTKLLTVGAIEFEPILNVGENLYVAAVKDPWGNVIGIIENPHFKIA